MSFPALLLAFSGQEADNTTRSKGGRNAGETPGNHLFDYWVHVEVWSQVSRQVLIGSGNSG